MASFKRRKRRLRHRFICALFGRLERYLVRIEQAVETITCLIARASARLADAGMDGRFGVSRSVGATKMSKQGAFGTAEEWKPESSRISDAIVDVRDGIFRQSLSGIVADCDWRELGLGQSRKVAR